ncbi:OmcA/MtrC family decaheme c-type cytochrome [Mangrovimicrobium sediminis]|uniref:OmcA/MtrC family decaheme c-type cytochrome n=1 Tax=Mangrovimicrobium sediminis TaxID=2562682 RepID=A0A4Z0M3S8_9GAMM|nr:OmcA/MtrC family decaheme c-type cytochrome [Haliea sp. SAOS-164]TGD74179.1 OmcA/MtrC family decaheme c-type cytochrome [Haliea sp. SAOS-164]
MATSMRIWIIAGLTALLVACGGGGGGDRAAGVEPGPPAPAPVDPPPPVQPQPNPAPYAEATELLAAITGASIDGAGIASVEFQLTDGRGTAITDLTIDNVRFVIAKLQTSPLGNLTGSWQSYINAIESAGSVGPGTEDKLQATYERNADGLVNHGDGTYTYTFAQSVSDLPAEILAQAETEGLDLSFDPALTHRVAIQFDGNPFTTANPHRDWVPASGATSGIFSMDIAATANCNRCHDPLGIHGGNRREIQYCVTCHNPGSTDANSGNTVDLKVMIHKIHRGASLPSVQAGGEYVIWGFRDSAHDYSNLHYPQDIRNCVNCHAGTQTGAGLEDTLQLTSQGDNWANVPSAAACGSCHDGVSDDGFDAPAHIAGRDESQCASCHSAGGVAGSIADSHRNLVAEASARFQPSITSVDSSMPGQMPVIGFTITDPQTGEAYDLLSDPVFTGASVNVRVAWDTDDYNNTGNGEEDASSVATSAFTAMPAGDDSYSLVMEQSLPDGSEAPFVPASGSGVAVIEGRLSMAVSDEEIAVTVPLPNTHMFFSIDEADGSPSPRRQSVELDNCLACHGSLSIHGGNRTDDLDNCVTCHNPRNTDREVRGIAASPPTDGKDEESLDFKTMIHGIHAAALRENPLEIVGFRGFNTYRYDTETVHYPGDLANCTACHTSDGFTLPLASSVLGSTVDTGEDHEDPADDTVVSPASAVCSSCHDDATARSHMSANGGDFATTQAALDDGSVVEQCSVCHGSGNIADVAEVHNPH